MRYYGPFQTTERINNVSFRLRLPDTWKIHNAFHVSLLKSFRGDVPDDGEPDEQPEVEENEEILVPEQILAHKDTKTKGVIEGDYNVFKRGAAPDAVFSTAVTALQPEDAMNTNRVKCVVNKKGYAIYFSRGLIPFNKSSQVNPDFPYLLHLGIQCYDAKFLDTYARLPSSPLQLEEDLEQLKVLENGYKMKVIKVDHEAHGVDSPEDISKIEALMKERNLG
ncbi:hypothetical protein L7F22_003438 [Adiantum nelumboides]|nr:hypothetical protein [Adiantum nelumboides]